VQSVAAAISRISARVSLARQHDLRKAHVLQEARLFGVADVGLGAGVELDRGQVEFQQAHVLDDQGVGAGFVELADQGGGAVELGCRGRWCCR
jgi:hypothetical protein